MHQGRGPLEPSSNARARALAARGTPLVAILFRLANRLLEERGASPVDRKLSFPVDQNTPARELT